MTSVQTKDQVLKGLKPGSYVECLDKGYVRKVHVFGTELDIVNAARASYAKESEDFSTADAKLVTFLAKEGHWAPFRHCFVTLEVKAPLEVARQWWKYWVGSTHQDPFASAWSEASRRYITMKTEFYIPKSNEWRAKPENNKQGSGGPLGAFEGSLLTSELEAFCQKGEQLYEWALAMGVAPEEARLFLPAYGMYLTWRASISLQGIMFFLSQRMEEGAQSEIRQYSKAVYNLVQPHFPVAFAAYFKDVNSVNPS